MLAVMVASRLDVLVVVALLLMFLVQAYTVSLFVRFQGDTRKSFTEVRQGLGEVRQGLGEVRQGLGEVRQGLGEVRQGLTAVTTELRGSRGSSASTTVRSPRWPARCSADGRTRGRGSHRAADGD